MKIAVSYRWLALLGLFASFAHLASLRAQSGVWSVGFDGGPVGYAGDLAINNRLLFNGGEAAFGLLFNWRKPQSPWAASLALRSGKFTGDDYRYQDDLYRLERAFFFRTSFVDAHAMGRFSPWPTATWSPYLSTGLGLVWIDAEPDFSRTKIEELAPGIALDQNVATSAVYASLPVGLGLVWKVNNRIDVQLAAQLNWTFTDYLDGISQAVDPNRNDYYGYVTLGFQYKLLPPDTDHDGRPDAIDECPNDPGPPSAYGCPDMDGDQVPDAADECPDQAGLPRYRGCPDSDGDLVPDHQDDCPQQPGWVDLNGCPWQDSDGDGTPDYIDPCPDSIGPADRQGCPLVDTDSDGLLDEDDLCPEVFGALIFRGCPDTDDDGIEDAKDACPYLLGSIQTEGCPQATNAPEEASLLNRQLFVFTANSDEIKQLKLAEKIGRFLLANPTASLTIGSHDDGGFSEDAGQNLALRRAKMLYEYWLQQGVDPAQLRYEVFGATQPLSQASTEAARDLNRRVTIHLILP